MLITARDLAEIERESLRLHALAGRDPADRPGAAVIAEKITGSKPRYDRLPFSRAELVTLNGRNIIYVREGTPKQRARWLVGHELGHVIWGRGYDPQLEAACDALGAFLEVPRAALERARAMVGSDPRRLARALDTTESLAFLRDAEVFGAPAALVSHVVRVRGTYEWGGEPEIRGLAKARRVPKGLRRVRIHDETPRVGLVARIA